MSSRKSSRSLARRQLYAGLAVFLMALVPRVVSLQVFLTPDEPNWMYRSIAFSIAVLNGDFGATIHEGTPGGIPTQWLGAISILSRYVIHRLDLVPFSASTVAGGGTSLLGYLEWLQGEPQNLLDILVAVRLSVAVVTSLGVLGIYILARKLFDAKTAILSALLLTMDPFYLAHSRVFHTDAVTSVFMILSALSFMHCFRERNPYFKFTFSWRYAVLSGIFAGLALSGKSSALVVIVFMALSAAGFCFLEIWKLKEIDWTIFPRLVIVLSLGILVGIAVFFLLWPAMWVNPVGTVRHLLAATVELVEEGHEQFFLGRVTTDPGPWFYPLVLLFKVTPLTLIGLGMNLATLVRSTHRRGNRALLWIYIILFVLFITPSPKKNDRYLLPIFPALNILSAAGIYELIAIVRKALWSQATGWVVRARYVSLTGCLILQAAFILPHHPYYFTYYNPVVGGAQLASHILLVGWGEGLDQAARYLSAKGEAKEIKAASWYGKRTFTHFFAGQLYPLSRGSLFWNGIDYAVLYINQVQRQLPDPQLVSCLRSLEPEYNVHMAGLDYAWIYKLPHPLPDCALPLQHAKQVQFGDSILFLGYEMVKKSETFDGKLRINLYWRALREMGEDYTIYLKLINDAYHIWGQQDSRPYWDGIPTNSWETGQVIGDPREIAVLPGTPQGLYRVEVILYDLHSGRTLEPLGGEKPLLGPVEVPRWESLTPESLDIGYPLGVNLGGKMRLLGYNIESGFRPGDNIHLTLFWQCLEEMEHNYTVFTHLIDAGDNIAAQKDNPPVDGLYPTMKWEMGEILRDQYDLVIPPETLPGRYWLEIGMYLAETGERLPVYDSNGKRLTGNRILQPLKVISQ